MISVAESADVDRGRLAAVAARSGYLKPYEGDEKLAAVNEILVDDLAVIGGSL